MFVHVQLRCTWFVLDSFNSYVSQQLYGVIDEYVSFFFDTQLLKLLRLFQTCKDVTTLRVLDSHFLVDRERKHSDATSINCLSSSIQRMLLVLLFVYNLWSDISIWWYTHLTVVQACSWMLLLSSCSNNVSCLNWNILY